jgi:hypothetical protein
VAQDYYNYGSFLILAEQLASSRFYSLWGHKVEVARAGLEGSFTGSIVIEEGETHYNASTTAQCNSANHRFTLSR